MSSSAVWQDWSCQVRLTVTNSAVLDRARRLLTDLMLDVESAASRFVSTSDVARINEAAGRLVPVGRRTVELVDVAVMAAEATNGLVDPTVGAHLVRAGYAEDIELVRDRLVLTGNSAVPRRADWRTIQVDHDLSRVGVPAGLALDLGATAKSWTADSAAHAISDLGTGVLVEIGGDVAVAGDKSAPWQIRVSERGGEPGEQVGLTGGGLATSSSAARGWRTANGPAHHIIDPRTGEPAVGPWRTATVWAHTALAANTASTAAIILGEDALTFLAERGHPARLVGRDGHVETVGTWPGTRQVA